MQRTQEVVTPDGDVVRRRPAVGDMRWDGTLWRRWTGRRWVRAAYALAPKRLEDPTPFDPNDALPLVEQQRALDLAVEDQVATRGATVVFAGPNGVVLAYRRRVSHVVHALLTLLTAGVWAIVWIVLVLARDEDRARLSVDRWGNVWAVRVASAP